ncbi:MAG: type III-A CRISPR-associated RAMP protein Csm3 [Cyanothece sp. SIO2G6]|nr:type III-A CRISPR-associated RAMP protein Csm3 [Cyanothece sp. SIO2G6]
MTVIDRPQRQLLGKVRVTAEIVVETGLHIGGGGQNLDIGGVDKPVIRDPATRYPYLPGSSIKGKLRSILERFLHKPLNRQGSRDTFRYESDDLVDGFTEVEHEQLIAFDGARTCTVSRIFGSTGATCWIPTTIADDESLDKVRNNSPRSIHTKKHIIGSARAAPRATNGR